MRFSLIGPDSNSAVSFVDSDGLVNNVAAREEPGHIDMMDGKWHLATLVQEPSSGYRIYLDGRLSGIVDVGIDSGFIDPTGNITLCSRSDYNEDRHFSGAVSNLRFYNEALTDKQVYHLYHSMQICDSKEDIRPSSSNRTCCLPATELDVQGDVNFDGVLVTLRPAKNMWQTGMTTMLIMFLYSPYRILRSTRAVLGLVCTNFDTPVSPCRTLLA